MKKKISILGSTGSIGVQTLEVLDNLKDEYELLYLTSNTRIELLAQQIKQYHPKAVVINNIDAYNKFQEYGITDCKVLAGRDALIEIASDQDNDLILSALVGFAGVEPAYSALKAGINLALANKETLVSAGSIITNIAKQNNSQIIAVDSEHSAIMQCLLGESINEVEKIILTASGGPFFNTPYCEFKNISLEQALAHPNWNMGNKITIDSATMMNKGFEVIEAYWLFDIEINKIDVLIHQQSIIHSMVQFVDGAVKAQLGLPDMRIPIAFALTYPKRNKFNFPRMNLDEISNLTFQKPDYQKFPCLKLAYQAINTGGNAPAILNAANEVAVDACLNKTIKFLDIPTIIEKVLNKIPYINHPSLEDIILSDKQVRIISKEFIKSFIN